MDFIPDLGNTFKFLNWDMIVAITLATLAWTQFWKKFFPSIIIKGRELPITEVFTILSGILIAHLFFDEAFRINANTYVHTGRTVILHGAFGALLSTLGFEILKGTKLGLRSSTDLKNGKT